MILLNQILAKEIHIGNITKENESYLETKEEKMGHKYKDE